MALALAQARGVYPQSLGGAVLPRDIPNGCWQTAEVSAAASYTITTPTCGVHLAVEYQLRGSQAASESSLNMIINGDATTGNYHGQRLGAQDGVATVGEVTTFVITLIAASTAVSGYYSSGSLYFPEFRNSARQKVCLVSSVSELAALNQRLLLNVHKRQGAGITGTLIDPVSTVQLAPASGTFSGTIRWAAVLR
jgi:hypothetical protein